MDDLRAYFFKIGLGSTTTNKTSKSSRGKWLRSIRSFSLPGFELLDAIAIHHGPILYTTPWSISGDGKAKTRQWCEFEWSRCFFGSSLRFILDVDPGKGGFHILYMIWRFQFNKTLDTTVITTLKLTSFRTFPENCTSLFIERQRRRASILPKYLLWQRNHWRVMPTSPLLVWWWSCWALPSTNCPLTQLLLENDPRNLLISRINFKVQSERRRRALSVRRPMSHPCPWNSEVETPISQATREKPTKITGGSNRAPLVFFGGEKWEPQAKTKKKPIQSSWSRPSTPLLSPTPACPSACEHPDRRDASCFPTLMTIVLGVFGKQDLDVADSLNPSFSKWDKCRV